MADLTTLAAVEGWLKLKSGNPDEALLSSLITAASAFVETWCNRSFALASYSENYDGTGGRRLALRNKPVTAVASLSIGGQVIPAGDPNRTPGYFFNESSVSLNGFHFVRGLGTVAIVYTAGFATIPADVAQAVNELVGLRYKERDRIGKTSEGLVNQTTAYLTRDMPPDVATLLAQYRNVVPA